MLPVEVLGLDHVHLPVADLPRSRQFYAVTIGLIVGHEDVSMVYFPEVGLILDLDDDGEVKGSGTTVGFSCDDVDAEYARLKERGALLDSPPKDREWGVRNFYLRDPDGHQIEFGQSLD